MHTKFKFVLLLLLSLTTWLTPADGQAPVILAADPPTNTVVRSLNFIYVFFNGNVTGVDASDLLINGVAATNVTAVSPAEYLFYFPPPPTGAVTVAWAPANGIVDQSDPPNAFEGGSWGYTLDPSSVTTTLVISEFLADNLAGIKDEDGSRSDWIEIFNPGPGDANLNGWFLTDTTNSPAKWRFPSVFLGANKYLLVWASAKNRANPAAPLHTSFKLAKESGYLALLDPTTNVVSKFDPYPPQQTDVSYGRDRVDPNLLGYYTTPTPGAQNSASGAGFATEPVFSLDTGIYTNSSLTLTLSAPLGTIRYTLNGSLPTNGSPVYAGPITFATNVIIKARVFPPAGNLFPSAVVAKNYLFLDNSTRDFNSNLPLLIIDMQGRAIPADVPPGANRPEGTFVVLDTFRGRSSVRNAPDFQGTAGFEVSGQTSAGFALKPIRIEIHDALGNDLDVPLLGMPADSDWRVRNPFDDKTLLNDYLGFELFEKMGHYSVRRRFVEVFVNGSVASPGLVTASSRLNYASNYYGVMVLVETIKQGKHRVDIPEITPSATNAPEITGGYIFKKDKDSTGDINFSTAGGTIGGNAWPAEALKVHEPKVNSLRVAQGVTTTWPGAGYTPSGSNQLSYLVGYLNQMEKALYASNWLTLTGTNHYSYYMDVDRFVDFHWTVEFTKQIDGYRLSSYFTKDRNGKVGPGPIWDWNLSYGNANYLRGGTTNVWYYEEQDQGMTANEHIWLRRLINGTPSLAVGVPGPGGDPDFNQKIADRWGVLRTNVCGLTNTLGEIDTLTTMLNEAAQRHAWGPTGRYRSGSQGLVGIYQWPNPDGITADGRDVDYSHPTNYLGGVSGASNSIIGQMKKWVTGRYLWIDGQFTPQPVFNTDGGLVTSGFTLTIVSPRGGTIYYTLDGSDPRGPGGTTNGLVYTGPITVTDNVLVTARVRQTGAWYNTWSAPSVVALYTAIPALRITEIMYHPLPPTPGPGVTNIDEDFEYLELKNVGATTLHLGGYTISGGVDFTFPVRDLAAGQRVLVVKNQAAFLSRYPGQAGSIAGEYMGNLDNAGNRLVLRGGSREAILDFEYDDQWYPITDGFGFSLVIVDENAALNTWGLASSWRPSGVLNGTPGQGDGAPSVFPRVVINEALTSSELPGPTNDVIELANLSGGPASVGGWYLTDDFRNPKKFRIPLNTPAIPAGGFLTFNESDFNVGGGGNIAFSLSSSGDEVYLFSADATGELTGYVHGFDFGPQLAGVTFGRYVLSTGEEDFVAQSSRTLGAANAGPKIGPIVISEIMYHPPDVFANGAYWDNPEDEYIELQNISGVSVPLYDPLNPGNKWRLRDAVAFTFPGGVVLPPGGYALVVSFNPNDASALAAFRNDNNVPAGTPIYGPWEGKLDNSQDSIELVQPAVPDPPGSPTAGQFSYVLADKVQYQDTAPWPTGLPDGLGASISRINAAAYGNDPTNWTVSPKTPGAPLPSGGIAPVIVTQPANTSGIEGQSASFSLTATGSAPGYVWTFNGRPLSSASSPILTLNNLKLADAGIYSCFVFNSAGSVQSSNVTLHVRQLPRVTQDPVNRIVRIKPDPNAAPNTNATFTVAATSVEPPISYQWRFNGADIPGANAASYTVVNVQLENEGDYSCAITDGVATVLSASARLTPWISPTFVQLPLSQTVVEGSDFSQSVQVAGNPVPFAFSWRRGSIVIATNSGNYRSNFITLNTTAVGLILTNNMLSSNYQMRLVVYNDANNSPGVLATYTNTVLADFDRDGIPDVVENALGLSPTDPADGALDLDGDGMSNRAEYIAGTDPANAASYLKIEQGITPGTATLRLAAVSNRTYTVQFTSDLNAGVWLRLADIVARPINHIETIADPTWTSNRLYRVVTPRQP